MSSELLPVDAPRYEQMAEVVELYVQNISETQIAKRLGIKRKDVVAHIAEWRKSALAQDFMKERVSELIHAMDEHYTLLIRKYYEIVDVVDNAAEETPQLLNQKKAALDSIRETDKQRIDILQKSGLLEAADLGDELAEMEEQKEAIIDILENDLCGVCQPRVMSRIAEKLKAGDRAVIVNNE